MSEIEGSTSLHRRHRAGDRRDEILDAVRDLAAEKGVSRLSVSEITQRVGCTRSLFYHYFPDKQAALDAALDRVIDGFVEELERWNASRTKGDIEGALDSIVQIMKRLVLFEGKLPRSITGGNNGALQTEFVDRASARTARYICDTTVRDFEKLHEVRIDHVYETFYVLISGLILFIRTHPDVPDDVLKDIAASTLHIEGFTAKYAERRPAR